MRSHESRMPLYVSLKAVALSCVLWGIAEPFAHSQESASTRPPTYGPFCRALTCRLSPCHRNSASCYT